MVDTKNLIENYKAYSSKNALVNYFLVLMFTAFPLFYTAQYSKIRHDKLYFFLVVGITLIFIQGAILLYNILTDKQLKIPSEKKWYQKLSVPDYAFAIMILSCIISTVFSKYPFDAILGTQGRNNGLLLLCVYFGIYIIISRLYVHKEYVFPLFAVTSLIVFILCILNFHYIDPLRIFANYSQEILEDFTSTIGNRNLMASFCCIAVPVFLMLYIHIEKPVRYLYFLTAGIGFAGLICANSECGFLGLIPTLAIIPIYASRDYKKLFGFFSSVSFMLVCGKLLWFMKAIRHKKFGSLQSFFIESNAIFFLIVVCVALAVFFYFRKNATPAKALFYVLLFGFIAGVVAVILLMIYFTFIDTKAKLGAITSYLRFSEKWGTHRGFIWIKSIEIFNSASLKEKLFGFGPDTFYYAFFPYFSELAKFGDSSTNCAHNEVLNYLITIGFIGTASYLTLIISVIARAFKYSKNNFLAVVFASSVSCYFLQSFVNIAQPITTPLFFIFIALTEAINKQYEK